MPRKYFNTTRSLISNSIERKAFSLSILFISSPARIISFTIRLESQSRVMNQITCFIQVIFIPKGFLGMYRRLMLSIMMILISRVDMECS